jgi:hypothetical protein
MADWLSECSVIGSLNGWNVSLMKAQIQMASFAAWVAATYSASVVDRVTISCLFELHETAPPSIRKTYPEIAWRSSFDIPSASVYPVMDLSVDRPRTNHRSFVPLR